MSSCDNPSSYAGLVELDAALGLNFYTPEVPLDPPTEDGRRVHLVWTVSRYNFHDTDGIRVRITAQDAYLMPEKIFAYLLLPMKPGAGERVGEFSHVCSPVDLEEYPEDEPIPGHRPEWFRLNYVDVLLRSRTEVHEFIREVTADVDRLKQTLDLMDTLLPGGEVWIGGAPINGDSSESSQGA